VLSCSLNFLYSGLLIANTFHRRVPGLHMIISLDKAVFWEFESNEDTVGVKQEHSIFNIRLTKYPTEEDYKHPGYNPAHELKDIAQPITE
jgi:hypothetical protein